MTDTEHDHLSDSEVRQRLEWRGVDGSRALFLVNNRGTDWADYRIAELLDGRSPR